MSGFGLLCDKLEQCELVDLHWRYVCIMEEAEVRGMPPQDYALNSAIGILSTEGMVIKGEVFLYFDRKCLFPVLIPLSLLLYWTTHPSIT